MEVGQRGDFIMMVVLQGRLRSTRLPAKGFFTFFGQTLWERVCDIALAVAGVDEVVFSSGSDSVNELIAPVVKKKGVRWFVGSEDNVYERYIGAIKEYKGEYLIRITSDNYLVQPTLIDNLYKKTSDLQSEYGHIAPLSHYAGEIIKCDTLRKGFKDRYSKLASEHVTWDIRQNPAITKAILPDDYMGIDHKKSVTLDTMDDFILMKQLETIQGFSELNCIEELRKMNKHIDTFMTTPQKVYLS